MNDLDRFVYHKKWLIRILKFEKWIDKQVDKLWNYHKSKCEKIINDWKLEEQLKEQNK